MKKFKVNENCIGCGACVSITDSEVFDFDDDTAYAVEGKNVIDEMDDQTLEKAMDALEGCPVSAIEIVEE